MDFGCLLIPETEGTLGYCFIEFKSVKEAELAKEKTDGFKFGKNGKYVLAVNLLDEFDRLLNTPDEWTPPDEKSDYIRENSQHWLTDEQGRDQFLIRVGPDTEVFWNDPRQLKPQLVDTVQGAVLNIFDTRTGKVKKSFTGSLEDLVAGGTGGTSGVPWPYFRYVATSVTSMHELENGVNIWSFFGKLLYRMPRDHFYQFLWRPRPPSLLTAEKEEEILQNLENFSKKYEDYDRDASTLLSRQDHERKKLSREEFGTWASYWKMLHNEEQDAREILRGGEENEEEAVHEMEEFEFEEVLDIVEELMIC